MGQLNNSELKINSKKAKIASKCFVKSLKHYFFGDIKYGNYFYSTGKIIFFYAQYDN